MQLTVKTFFFYFFIFNAFFCFSQATKNNFFNKIATEIELLKKDKDLQSASWGIYAINTKTNQIVANYNAHLSLIPASTLKTVTTAAVLGSLGSQYRYETRLEYDGYIDKSTATLYGNIYIRGSGDPSLGSEYFATTQDSSLTDKWAQVILKAGIHTIEGAVIGDESVFEDELVPSEWIWGDIGNYYGLGACGLNYTDNKYSLFFKTGQQTGDSTHIVRMSPFIPSFELQNKVTTGGTDDKSVIYGSPYCNYHYVSGTLPAGHANFEVKGSLPDPSWFCAYTLQRSLEKVGVKVEQNAGTVREMRRRHLTIPQKRNVLHTHFSPTLDKLVYYTNLKSNNLYAEALMKTLALQQGEAATESNGINAIKKYWRDNGVETDGLNMLDGCGLARADLVTAYTEVQMLRVFMKDKEFKSFYNSLPVAGKSGSLSSMCKGSNAENNLRAKSGYMTKVRTYAGYVANSKGEMIVFALLFNNYSCTAAEAKNKMERLMVLLAE